MSEVGNGFRSETWLIQDDKQVSKADLSRREKQAKSKKQLTERTLKLS